MSCSWSLVFDYVCLFFSQGSPGPRGPLGPVGPSGARVRPTSGPA